MSTSPMRMEIASHPCNVVSLLVEVSDITDGASGHLGEKIPCPPTQKQAKQEGDEGGVALHPIYKTLAFVQNNDPSSGGLSSAKPSVITVDNQTSLANLYLCAIAGDGA
jgi:hypothetical protein